MDQSVGRIGSVLAALLCAIIAAGAAGQASAAEEQPADLPWALRDHYAVAIGNGRFLYAVENAEWCVEVDGAGALADHVGFAVTLGDGTRLESTAFEKVSEGREPFSDSLGEGTQFSVTLSSPRGLVVRHHVSVYKKGPFVTVSVSVRNGGDSPVPIASISPAVFGSSDMPGLLRGTAVKRRWLAPRGSHPVFTKKALPLSVMFVDRARDATVALGALPGGVATSGAEFQPVADTWRGEMLSAFDPPLRLERGATLDADPVWVCFGLPEHADVSHLFSWAYGASQLSQFHDETPNWWVTVEDGAPASALFDAAQQWERAGVRHALVPGSWEGGHGSLQGATPWYPREMGGVADALDKMGLSPGITVDPLAASGRGKAWTVTAADGQRWVNVAHPDAYANSVKRLKKMVQWGFEFFVVQPSLIPDEVLGRLNVTRRQADAFAFEVMSRAAGDLPVLASTATTLKGDVSAWLEAASSAAGMSEYGVGVGPVRLDVTGIEAPSEALAAAMTFFEGPLEVIGDAKPSVQRWLAQVLPRCRISLRPLDAAERAPKVWEAPMREVGDGPQCAALVVFPGAPAWSISAIPLGPAGPVHAWLPGKKAALDLASGHLPAADTLAVYAVAPALTRPALVSAVGGSGLPHNHVTELRWDESAAALSGRYDGGRCLGGTVYVFVPDGWRFRSSKTGGVRLGRRHSRNLMAFDVAGGKDIHFELYFRPE